MKKYLSLLLCVLLAAAVFSACAGNGGDTSKDPSSGSETNSESSDSQTSEPSSEHDHLSNPNIYKGSEYRDRTFTVLTFGVGATPVSEFVYNEETADEILPSTVSEAIRDRNNKVNDELGVTIAEIYKQTAARFGGETLNTVRNAISSADDKTFQAISICLYDCGTLALENSLYDLNSLENINMENPWWEQSFNKSVTIAGQLYFTIGDIGFNHKDSTPCVYYNTRLIDDLGLQDPIELAVSGDWTIDKALEYSKKLLIDSSPPIGIDYKDEFGWAGQNDDMYAMLYGAGVKILSPDPEGFLTLTMKGETAIGTIDKVIGLMLDDSYVSGNDFFHVSTTPMVLLQEAFQEGRCLFYSGGINSAKVFDMPDVFGILPVPKYTAEQDDYYSLINTWVTNAYCIAANCGEEAAEFAAAVMDVAGYFSWIKNSDSLAFNYYEKMLKNQKLAREDSEAMLDLIFSARGCELGAIFQIGKKSGSTSVNEMLVQLITAKAKGGFVAAYDKYSQAFETDVDELNDYFRMDK